MKPWYQYVYIIECNGLYKIGYSKNPLRRLKQLRTGSPFPSSLVRSIKTPCFRQLEDKLHRRFWDKHEQGEWFRLTEKDLLYIYAIDGMGKTKGEREEESARAVETRKEVIQS